jgi:hypothetical protein
LPETGFFHTIGAVRERTARGFRERKAQVNRK